MFVSAEDGSGGSLLGDLVILPPPAAAAANQHHQHGQQRGADSAPVPAIAPPSALDVGRAASAKPSRPGQGRQRLLPRPCSMASRP